MDRSRRFRSVIAAACVLISLLPGCGENRSDQPKAAVPSSNPAASVPEPAQARPLEFSITPRYEVALFLLDEPSDMLTAEATRVIEQVRPEASIVNDFSEQITKAEFLVELLSTEKYTVPDEKYLGYFGRGMTKDQAKAVQSSKHALILVAFSPRDESLSMVRDMEQIVARLQASTGALVYDGETHEMFTGEAWKARRIDTWDGDVPNVRQQIVLHSYPTGQLTRCVSLGMVKFGYPDVAVNEVPRSFSRSMASLVNLLCHTRVERSDDPTASTVALDIDALKHAELRELMIKSLEEKATRRASVRLARSTPEEGDPDNELVELVFDGLPDESLQVRQQAVVSALFGARDSVEMVKHNAAVEEVSRKARALCIAEKKPLIQKGLPTNHRLLVKAPFAAPDGRQEWMWVEVTEWEAERISGILMNDPYFVPNLKAGANVNVDESVIFDYLHYLPDGEVEGNTTAALLSRPKEPAKDEE